MSFAETQKRINKLLKSTKQWTDAEIERAITQYLNRGNKST